MAKYVIFATIAALTITGGCDASSGPIFDSNVPRLEVCERYCDVALECDPDASCTLPSPQATKLHCVQACFTRLPNDGIDPCLSCWLYEVKAVCGATCCTRVIEEVHHDSRWSNCDDVCATGTDETLYDLEAAMAQEMSTEKCEDGSPVFIH